VSAFFAVLRDDMWWTTANEADEQLVEVRIWLLNISKQSQSRKVALGGDDLLILYLQWISPYEYFQLSLIGRHF